MVRIQHPVFPRGPALYHLGRIIGEKPMGGGPAAAARRIAAVADSDISKRRKAGRSQKCTASCSLSRAGDTPFYYRGGAPIISRRSQPSTRFEDEMKTSVVVKQGLEMVASAITP